MALNTWAAKNLGPDADISRMPGSGGGGDSDFSTATVTVTYETSGDSGTHIYLPYLYVDEGEEEASASGGTLQIDANEPVELTVIVYKGEAFFTAAAGTLTVTGDIEAPPFPGPFCTIKGNGTITISDIL